MSQMQRGNVAHQASAAIPFDSRGVCARVFRRHDWRVVLRARTGQQVSVRTMWRHFLLSHRNFPDILRLVHRDLQRSCGTGRVRHLERLHTALSRFMRGSANLSVERMAAGGAASQSRERLAAAIAHFKRSATRPPCACATSSSFSRF